MKGEALPLDRHAGLSLQTRHAFAQQAVLTFIGAIADIPADRRADLFDGLSLLLAHHRAFDETAQLAAEAAFAIREAESAQLLLKGIFGPAFQPNPKP